MSCKILLAKFIASEPVSMYPPTVKKWEIQGYVIITEGAKTPLPPQMKLICNGFRVTKKKEEREQDRWSFEFSHLLKI